MENPGPTAWPRTPFWCLNGVAEPWGPFCFSTKAKVLPGCPPTPQSWSAVLLRPGDPSLLPTPAVPRGDFRPYKSRPRDPIPQDFSAPKLSIASGAGCSAHHLPPPHPIAPGPFLGSGGCSRSPPSPAPSHSTVLGGPTGIRVLGSHGSILCPPRRGPWPRPCACWALLRAVVPPGNPTACRSLPSPPKGSALPPPCWWGWMGWGVWERPQGGPGARGGAAAPAPGLGPVPGASLADPLWSHPRRRARIPPTRIPPGLFPFPEFPPH